MRVQDQYLLEQAYSQVHEQIKQKKTINDLLAIATSGLALLGSVKGIKALTKYSDKVVSGETIPKSSSFKNKSEYLNSVTLYLRSLAYSNAHINDKHIEFLERIKRYDDLLDNEQNTLIKRVEDKLSKQKS